RGIVGARAARVTKARGRAELGAAPCTGAGEMRSALLAEARLRTVLVAARSAAHRVPSSRLPGDPCIFEPMVQIYKLFNSCLASRAGARARPSARQRSSAGQGTVPAARVGEPSAAAHGFGDPCRQDRAPGADPLFRGGTGSRVPPRRPLVLGRLSPRPCAAGC